MTGQENIVYCGECRHCFESRRSSTGYACEVWGHEDFACPTIPSGYCHKGKPRVFNSDNSHKISLNDLLNNAAKAGGPL